MLLVRDTLDAWVDFFEEPENPIPMLYWQTDALFMTVFATLNYEAEEGEDMNPFDCVCPLVWEPVCIR